MDQTRCQGNVMQEISECIAVPQKKDLASVQSVRGQASSGMGAVWPSQML